MTTSFPTRRAVSALSLALGLSLGAPAAAQMLGELLTATAISATLDSGMTLKLPVGSAFFKDPKAGTELAGKLLGADAGKYTAFQLYVSRGLATRLADNFVGDLATQFAVAGYFQTAAGSLKVGGETWTRTEFSDDATTIVLLTARRPDGVYLLTAKKK